MSLIVDGTNGVTFNDSSLQGAAASPYVLKNRIINGAMEIDQRNAGASITASDGSFGVDRFKTAIAGSGVFTMQQSSTAPTGFSYSQLLTITTADTSIAASDEYSYRQFIEGYNTADLAWGTANAKTITLSFWVRSSVTGTYAVGLRNSAADRAYPATYTISSANTWEQKTITIAGDTSGTWLTTNGVGIGVIFSLGAGSNNQGTANSWNSGNLWSTSSATQWISNAGATFYITGVQLEIGTSATPFERRLYGQELANCQRYFEKTFPQNIAPAHNTGFITFLPIGGSAGCGGNTYWSFQYKVTKRTDCTIRSYDPTGTGSASSNLWRTYTACNSGNQGSGLNLSTACDSFFSGYTQGGTDVTTAFLWTAECEL